MCWHIMPTVFGSLPGFIGQTKPKLVVYYQHARPKKSKGQEFRESRFSSREVRISWYHICSCTYVSRGTLPTKKEAVRKGTWLRDLGVSWKEMRVQVPGKLLVEVVAGIQHLQRTLLEDVESVC